jgi:hypothetical protein
MEFKIGDHYIINLPDHSEYHRHLIKIDSIRNIAIYYYDYTDKTTTSFDRGSWMAKNLIAVPYGELTKLLYE